MCVDTVPLLERLYGRYAGLGWIGKHGCLINARYGSWFVLGEILLNLELEYDPLLPDRCGRCTRCLDACPTGAIAAPRLLDARRCLSYLTIELKESIPEKHRSGLENTIFGCDRCQEVCPWNQQAEAPGIQEFLPRAYLDQPDLAWLLTLSREQFHAHFKHSAIKRTKLRGIVRNAVIAAGNSHNNAYIPLLQRLYENTEPLIQSHIAWALEQLSFGP